MVTFLTDSKKLGKRRAGGLEFAIDLKSWRFWSTSTWSVERGDVSSVLLLTVKRGLK